MRPKRRHSVLRLFVVAGVAATLVPLTAGIASATPSTTPTITTPTAGDTITTVSMAIEASSTATLVRFVLDGREGPFTVDATVNGGVADATIDVAGIDGDTTLAAYDCDSSSDCNTVADTIGLTIALPPPGLIAPSNGNIFPKETLTARAVDITPSVGFTVDGVLQTVDTSSPYVARLSLASVPDGTHKVAAVQCDASGTVCEGQRRTSRRSPRTRRGHAGPA